MKYRDVYKEVCKQAAEHLYSLEIFDEFDDEDSDKVQRAIDEIQRQLFKKAEKRYGDDSDKILESLSLLQEEG